MIMTRRFGALRARPVFPSVIEQDGRLEYHGDVRSLDLGPEHRRADADESAA